MQWLIHYDVAALIICIILFFVFYLYRSFPTWQNQIYGVLLSASLASIAMDIVTCISNAYLKPEYYNLNYLLTIIYLLLFNLVPVLYYLLLLAVTKGRDGLKWYNKVFIVVPYLISIFLIVSTPVTKLVIDLGYGTKYEHGIGMSILYLISMLYLIMSLAVTIRFRNKLNKLQRYAVIFYTVSSISVVVVQYFMPKYLLIGFSIAMSMFFIFLTLQNPLEYKDATTGAFNREAFVRLAVEEIEKKKPFTIVGIQMDGFQFIYDKFGIENGDLLLAWFASFLKNLSCSNKVFHLSGTQFAVMIESGKKQELLIDKITERFKEPFYLNGIEVCFWAYLCSFRYPDDVGSLTDVIDMIDYSMKKARQQKRNCVVYGSDQILKQKQRENAVEQSIERAIANDEFDVYYQPIFSISEKCYTGAEALVRLKDKELGFIPPDEFIPMAEKNGQILKIGELVFQKVCQFISKERLWERDISFIHVNLSVVQCMQEELADELCAIMDQYHIPYDMIIFEITETSAINSGEKLEENMEQLRNRGIRFSLDDYGTGYSNTANIMQHPYNVIKLDKSIVWAAQESRQALISLKHTTAMIKELNMGIVAEGVETEEQKQMLEEMACDFFQGYYYSRPLPEEEFLKLI